MIRIAEGWTPRTEAEENAPWYLLQNRKRTKRVEPIAIRVIDPATQKRSEAGKPTIFQRFNGERNGMGFIPANNNWDAGRDIISNLLKARLPDGSPVFRVFSTCTDFKNEADNYCEEKPIEEMKNDPPPGGKPMRKSDHLMDTWRYISLIPGGLRDIQQETNLDDNDWDNEDTDYDSLDDLDEKPGSIAQFKKQQKENERW
jgi:hypothetical protein